MRILATVMMVALGLSSVHALAAPKKPAKPAATTSVAERTEIFEDRDDPADEIPSLGGYRFLHSAIVDSPFIADQVTMSFGFGTASFDQAQDDGTKKELNFVGPAPRIESQFALGSWVGLTTRFDAVILAATNESTAGVLAESLVFQVEPGIVARVFKTENHMLSLAGEFSYGQGYTVSPLGALVNAVNTGTIQLRHLFSKRRILTYSPGARYAFGFADMMGITFESKVQIANTQVEKLDSTTDTSLFTGATYSIDLFPRGGVPIGFTAGYAHTFGLSSGSKAQNQITGGIFGTSSPRFKPGLEVETYLADGESLFSGHMSMRYYF